jgi:hypothetical protein
MVACSAASRISPSLQTTQPVGIPRAFFDSKAGRLLHRAQQTLGWPDGSERVKASGSTGGNWSGCTAGETSGADAVAQGGNSSGNATVAQSEPESMAQGGELSGELSGVELHVVDGRLIACKPGEPPPLSVRQHTQVFLEWLRAHEKVPGNEVPVALMADVLYWDFLGDTGLPMKSWRTVSDILAKLPGVDKYQADWRDPAGRGPTPIVFKIRKPRRAKVVRLAERREAS